MRLDSANDQHRLTGTCTIQLLELVFTAAIGFDLDRLDTGWLGAGDVLGAEEFEPRDLFVLRVGLAALVATLASSLGVGLARALVAMLASPLVVGLARAPVGLMIVLAGVAIGLLSGCCFCMAAGARDSRLREEGVVEGAEDGPGSSFFASCRSLVNIQVLYMG